MHPSSATIKITNFPFNPPPRDLIKRTQPPATFSNVFGLAASRKFPSYPLSQCRLYDVSRLYHVRPRHCVGAKGKTDTCLYGRRSVHSVRIINDRRLLPCTAFPGIFIFFVLFMLGGFAFCFTRKCWKSCLLVDAVVINAVQRCDSFLKYSNFFIYVYYRICCKNGCFKKQFQMEICLFIKHYKINMSEFK